MYETTEHIRPRLYALLVLVLLGVGAGGFAVYSIFSGSLVVSDVIPDFEVLTPVTLFYAAFLSGLFFVPVPIELAFIAGVRAGSPYIPSAVAVMGGFALGNLVSYLVGWKLSRFVMHLVNAKQMYGLRRKVNTYGGYAVLAFSLLPAPTPQLNFALGMARYNMARLFSLFFVGMLIKYVAIGLFFMLT